MQMYDWTPMWEFSSCSLDAASSVCVRWRVKGHLISNSDSRYLKAFCAINCDIVYTY